jgi:Domain of unknown function (DUF4158)/Nuclease-related domain
MPVQFLSESDHERLNCFPTEIPSEDLTAYFLLSAEDMTALRPLRGDRNRLGYAMQLCTLRYLGFFPEDITTLPARVVTFVAEQLLLSPEVLENYSTRQAGKSLIFKTVKNLFLGSDKQFQTSAKGMAGERKVGKVLKQLPEGWRVWHDLDIGGENIDHVVASAKGVFIIEAKNYSGSVLATPKGLYSHGNKTPSKIVTQAWRQTFKLNDHLGGQFVFPVLVFMGEVKGDKAKGIPCVRLEVLLPYLRDQKNVLSYDDARRLFATLDRLTK